MPKGNFVSAGASLPEATKTHVARMAWSDFLLRLRVQAIPCQPPAGTSTPGFPGTEIFQPQLRSNSLPISVICRAGMPSRSCSRGFCRSRCLATCRGSRTSCGTLNGAVRCKVHQTTKETTYDVKTESSMPTFLLSLFGSPVALQDLTGPWTPTSFEKGFLD